MYTALYMLLYYGHLSNIMCMSFHFMTEQAKMHYGHRAKEAKVFGAT